MAIRLVVTGGYGNGTFAGRIAEVVTRGYTPGEPAEAGIPAHVGAGSSFDPASLYAEAEEIVRRALEEFERRVKKAKTRKKVEAVITEYIPELRLPESFIASYSSELLETLRDYMLHDAKRQDILAAVRKAKHEEEEEIAVIMMLTTPTLWN